MSEEKQKQYKYAADVFISDCVATMIVVGIVDVIATIAVIWFRNDLRVIIPVVALIWLLYPLTQISTISLYHKSVRDIKNNDIIEKQVEIIAIDYSRKYNHINRSGEKTGAYKYIMTTTSNEAFLLCPNSNKGVLACVGNDRVVRIAYCANTYLVVAFYYEGHDLLIESAEEQMNCMSLFETKNNEDSN